MAAVNKTVFNLLEFWFLGSVLVIACIFNAMLYHGDYTWECETFHTRIHGTGDEIMPPPPAEEEAKFYEAPYFECARFTSKRYGAGAGTVVSKAIDAAKTRCAIEEALGCHWDEDGSEAVINRFGCRLNADGTACKSGDGGTEPYTDSLGACLPKAGADGKFKTPDLDVKRCYSLRDYAKDDHFPNLHKDNADEARMARTLVLVISILFGLASLCRIVWHIPYFYESNQQAVFIDKFLRVADWLLLGVGVGLSIYVIILMRDILLNSREKIDKAISPSGWSEALTDAHWERMEYDQGFWITVTLSCLLFITFVWQCLHIVDAFAGTFNEPRGLMTIPTEMRLQSGMRLRFARVFQEHRIVPSSV